LLLLAAIMTIDAARGGGSAPARWVPLDGRRLARTAALALPSPTATPLATGMVLLLVVSAAVLRTHPADVAGIVSWASTNVHNLAHHPVAAMLVSTFVVPGDLLPELMVVAVGFAVLERAIGARRTAAIGLAGQVVASLLTEYGADLGVHWHLLAESSPERSDVGVSYVMYAVLAAAVLTAPGRLRFLGLAGVGAYVLVPFVLAPDMTGTGHLLSVLIGAGLATGMRLRRRRAARRTSSTGPPIPRPAGHLLPVRHTAPPGADDDSRRRKPSQTHIIATQTATSGATSGS
jgi:hypothetical protein